MACTNSSAHRFLLPSVVPKASNSPCDSWLDTATMHAELLAAPVPLHGPVYILGKTYDLPKDHDAMESDIYSRFWFSYRKNFRQIGDTNYRTDSGWGCTLRCGQMMLAHCLIIRHLGREWRYDGYTREENYNKILNMFHDERDSEYSIQMIALQGGDLGRGVGQWFGPNNVAHSIKRLCQYDHWSKIAVYVALDMLVVIEDIKELCRKPHGISSSFTVEVTTDNGERVTNMETEQVKNMEVMNSGNPSGGKKFKSFGSKISKSDPILSEPINNVTSTAIKTKAEATTHSKLSAPFGIKRHPKLSLSFSPTSIPNSFSRSYDPNADSALLNLTMEDFQRQFSGEPNLSRHDEAAEDGSGEDEVDSGPSGVSSPEHIFRPLLLFIPLRLGQEKFNMEYADALKACFTLPQCVGIIGGKPRHALWFIGYHDNQLLHFDPHTTQSYVAKTENGHIPDETYHLRHADRLPIHDLDPSLALGFFCRDESDIDDMMTRLQSNVLSKMSYMFELTQHRPSYLGPPDSAKRTPKEPFILLEPVSIETDEGFEIVEWPYPAPVPEKGSWPHPSS